MKFIRFFISLGGDSGWRFTNSDEWHSIKYPLFFDSGLWTMARIKEEMDCLERETGMATHGCWELKDNGNAGGKCVRRFIEMNDGVFVLKPKQTKSFGLVNRAPWGCSDIREEKMIDEPVGSDVIGWELDGRTVNC